MIWCNSNPLPPAMTMMTTDTPNHPQALRPLHSAELLTLLQDLSLDPDLRARLELLLEHTLILEGAGR